MVATNLDWLAASIGKLDFEISDTDLTRALKQVHNDAWRYRICNNYYKGHHQLAFATEKFRNAFGSLFRKFADNLCPAVCDAVSDNLQVIGFGVEKGPARLAKDAQQIWQTNRMDQRAGEVHREAVKTGDAYAIVWPDRDGNPIIYPQKAAFCTVRYDEEQPGLILWGAKFWRSVDLKIRCNLYYPDRIEKYISRGQSANGMPDRSDSFIRFKVEGERWPAPNDFEAVPMFHFSNNAAVGEMGSSELVSVIPLQDALNKSILDMMVAMEFAAFSQRWATGIEVTLGDDGKPIAPFIPGVERLWTTESTDSKFGQFDSTDLDQFIQVENDLRLEIARVSATPLHYLNLQGGSIPSGEALKTLEKRHIKKVKDRMTVFGNVWEDVMRLALLMTSGRKDLRLSTDWADPFGPSDSELLDSLVTKKSIGVSEEQLLKEAGYGEDEIAVMQEQNAARRQANQRDFNAL